MGRMADRSVDLILTDPPYGATNNEWDKIVHFMDEALRVSPVVILTAMQPYSSRLVVDYQKYFKYELIWEKPLATGHLNAKIMPLRAHEQILIFSTGKAPYFPQKTDGHKPVNSYTKHQTDGSNYGKTKTGISGGGSTERYPRSVIQFSSDKQKSALHPTQKPLALFEYLIKTYSVEYACVYDPFMGSGTTAIAAERTGREWVGSEISKKYCQIIEQRLAEQSQ